MVKVSILLRHKKRGEVNDRKILQLYCKKNEK